MQRSINSSLPGLPAIPANTKCRRKFLAKECSFFSPIFPFFSDISIHIVIRCGEFLFFSTNRESNGPVVVGTLRFESKKESDNIKTFTKLTLTLNDSSFIESYIEAFLEKLSGQHGRLWVNFLDVLPGIFVVKFVAFADSRRACRSLTHSCLSARLMLFILIGVGKGLEMIESEDIVTSIFSNLIVSG
jgi:hypothetical protein